MKARDLFFDAVFKAAGWEASYMVVPNTVAKDEREEIIKRLKAEFPDTAIHSTPHGEEIYPASSEEFPKVEKAIRMVNPEINIQIGASKSMGGGTMYKRPRYGDYFFGVSSSSNE